MFCLITPETRLIYFIRNLKSWRWNPPGCVRVIDQHMSTKSHFIIMIISKVCLSLKMTDNTSRRLSTNLMKLHLFAGYIRGI